MLNEFVANSNFTLVFDLNSSVVLLLGNQFILIAGINSFFVKVEKEENTKL